MSYSHRWVQKRDMTKNEWKIFTDGVESMVEAINLPKRRKILCWEYDEVSTDPQIDNGVVRFNGRGEDGCETFLITRLLPTRRPSALDGTDIPRGYSFCKTNRQDYDVAVTACLTVLASLGTHEVTSDGEADEWLDGMDLALTYWPQLTLVNPIATNDNERAA